MLYNDILYGFREELEKLKTGAKDFKTEIRTCHALCNRTLNQMRKAVLDHGFKDREEEIRFFREIKVEPMSFLVYYVEVSSFLANKPKNHNSDCIRYIERQMARVDDFLTKNVEFLIYMESRDDHLDPYYFTRGFLKENMLAHRYPYFKDAEFETDKDYLLAKIRGWGMYVAYLKKKKRYMEILDNGTTAPKEGGGLTFTGRPIEAAELIYALAAAGSINHGRAKISEIIRGLSDIFGLDPGEVYKKFDDIKKRKDKVIYLEKLRDALLRKLEEADSL